MKCNVARAIQIKDATDVSNFDNYDDEKLPVGGCSRCSGLIF